jgi:uncharacterized protein (TIGR02118 family)
MKTRERRGDVIRLTIMYPDSQEAYFDMEYYRTTHIPMVLEKCGPAIKECSVEQGLGGGAPDSPAPYRVIARLSVESMDDFVAHVAPHDPDFAADVPNFTNIVPVIQINEVIM